MWRIQQSREPRFPTLFLLVKLMNEKLDEIRRAQYNMEKDINKRKVLKGTRDLLLCNGADIFDKEYKKKA